MVKSHYIPERGDIVWLDFDPVLGHEQGGHRPALVISRSTFNDKSGLMLVCPITSIDKNYPFDTQIKGKHISGVILADQLKSIDWNVRNARYIERAETIVFNDVISKLLTLVE